MERHLMECGDGKMGCNMCNKKSGDPMIDLCTDCYEAELHRLKGIIQEFLTVFDAYSSPEHGERMLEIIEKMRKEV